MFDEERTGGALLVLPLLIVTLDLSAGILAYTLVGERVGALRPEYGLPGLLPFALAGALAGSLLGLGQWAALRRKVPWADHWLLIAAIGLAAGLSLGIAVLRALTHGRAGEVWTI